MQTLTHHAQLFLVGDSRFNTPDNDNETTVITVSNFGIEEARDLKEAASRAPSIGSYRRFCIQADAVTVEAQNALLKLFEDPPETARFELCVPKEDILLATLRSRLAYNAARAGKADITTAQTFVGLTVSQQLDEISARTKEKDQVWLTELLAGLEELRTNPAAKRALILVSGYIQNRGASKKMLLEHLALSISEHK